MTCSLAPGSSKLTLSSPIVPKSGPGNAKSSSPSRESYNLRRRIQLPISPSLGLLNAVAIVALKDFQAPSVTELLASVAGIFECFGVVASERVPHRILGPLP